MPSLRRLAPLAASLTTSLAATLTIGLGLSLVAACSSSAPRKGTQVPSEMLGPSEGGAAGGATGGPRSDGDAQAAPAGSLPADGQPGEASEGAAAALTVDEKAIADELATIMKDVTSQFERLVLGLEQAGTDCKKAAASLDGARKASAPVEERMKAFRGRLQSKGQPSQGLMAALQQVTLAAFPTALRARADSTFERLDKQCASDAEFQRAKQATVDAQAGG